jgi:hypothetical protein
VTLELSPSLRYLYGATTKGTVNIIDNDKPTVSISATDPDAAEANLDPQQA